MSQQRLDIYNQAPLGIERGIYGSQSLTANEIYIGNQKITAVDIERFHKMLEFMDFALGASEELRALMVAFEAKQRLLK